MDLHTNSKRLVPVFGSMLRWLPGDTEVLVSTGYFGDGDIVQFNLNTGIQTPLNVVTRFPSFDVSRDGRYVFYQGYASDGVSQVIKKFDRTSNAVETLTIGGAPDISPDGNKLLYGNDGTFVLDLNSGKLQQVFEFPTSAIWGPNDCTIYFYNAIGYLMRRDCDGKIDTLYGTENLSGAFGPIDISPDGRVLLFNKFATDHYLRIWSLHLYSNRATQLTF